MKDSNFKMVVFYDGWCPLCNNIKDKIKKIDWLNSIKMVSIRSKEIKEINIPKSALEKEMYAIILKNNRIVSGAEAFLEISARIPLLIPLWPILKFLNVIGLGKKFYNLVARNRSIIPIGKCDDSTCELSYKKGE
ncbi:thiol-disulfide oxidoreductase DCC family protein [Bacillus tropicus]|uniref:thiol-disulfide oxidoreductase DCC family protein n=1 Tax=Bacillus tropicus TaxID=2026188 RepID=UPI000BFD03B3|nr:DUF393 domain-containing protein [Bacillus tropicus]MDE7553438.1 DUF393 domain-containing protein [Bacillus tropicus]MDE7574191.1 DUF393 domain-containing protein [Bacillus tropicus]PGX17874.1 hypothetical protein COE33_29850 [Bacillus anthracis]